MEKEAKTDEVAALKARLAAYEAKEKAEADAKAKAEADAKAKAAAANAPVKLRALRAVRLDDQTVIVEGDEFEVDAKTAAELTKVIEGQYNFAGTRQKGDVVTRHTVQKAVRVG